MRTPQEIIDATWVAAFSDVDYHDKGWEIVSVGWVEERIAVLVATNRSSQIRHAAIEVRFDDDSLTTYMTRPVPSY